MISWFWIDANIVKIVGKWSKLWKALPPVQTMGVCAKKCKHQQRTTLTNSAVNFLPALKTVQNMFPFPTENIQRLPSCHIACMASPSNHYTPNHTLTTLLLLPAKSTPRFMERIYKNLPPLQSIKRNTITAFNSKNLILIMIWKNRFLFQSVI